MCEICQTTKAHAQNTCIYLPLPISKNILEDLSIDFILGLPLTPRRKDSLFIEVDQYSKIALFILCCKTMDVVNIANNFFTEIVQFHGVSRTITLDRDVKLVSLFWRVLWWKFNTSLDFSNAYHPHTDKQIEVVNKTLTTMVWSIAEDKPKSWDLALDLVEFAFNSMEN